VKKISDFKIKHIIFDLGGVLLNINPLLSLEAFAQLGKISTHELQDRLKSEKLFEKYDTGEYSNDVFRAELCRILGVQLSNETIDKAWNCLLLDFPENRVNLLKEIKANFSIFLLSNTNAIHYQSYCDAFFARYGTAFSDLFCCEYLSFRMGKHKPDVEIFHDVIRMSNLNPRECLFIDDLLPNVEAAIKCGMHGLHIDKDIQVTDFFQAGYLKDDLIVL